MYAIVVIAALHIVVGPNGEAHPAPCCQRAVTGKGLLGSSSVERSLTRNGHQSVYLGCYGILDKIVEELIWVEHVPRLGVVNLKMQVRSRRVARITAKGNELALADRNIGRLQTSIGLTGLMLVLILAESPLDAWRKRLQMTIDRSLSCRMSDIDSIAKTVLSDGDTADITVTYSIDMLAFHALSTDVKPAVKMVRARLTEIPRQ